MNVTVSPGPVHGTVRVPASKSHTIRALVIAALADGESRILSPLDSADTQSCVRVLRQLGIDVAEERDDAGTLMSLVVSGGGGMFTAPDGPLDCGNSGTTFYIMLSVASLADFPVTLTGDEQLQKRSAGPLLNALEQLGVRVRRDGSGDCPPVTVTGPLRGGEASISCPTSQYLTSLLLACPLARIETHLAVPLLNEVPYVEMTLDWLDSQDIRPERTGWSEFRIGGGRRYRPVHRPVPADFSAATFFLAAAAITGSTLELAGLDMDDSQGDKEVIRALVGLGCSVSPAPDGIAFSGPSGGLAEAILAGGEVDLNAMPDALPALAVVGTACVEPLRLSNVPQAREKETDRIAVMASELSALGAQVRELPDGLVVNPSPLSGGRVSSHGDHRVAMALAVAGLRSAAPVTITNAEVAAITYPEFYRDLAACGAHVSTE